MNKSVTVVVNLELPADLLEGARAVVAAETAFDDMKAKLAIANVTATVSWPVAVQGRPSQSYSEPGWRTPERAALIERGYPTYPTFGQLMSDLRALPGPEFTTNSVVSYAHQKGLRRPLITAAQLRAAEFRKKRWAKASNGSHPAAEGDRG